MQTLIELFDNRPIENILASEVFKPEKVIFLVTEDNVKMEATKQKYTAYLRHKNVSTEIVYVKADLYDTYDILEKLERIINENPDCCLDITGGTDAALFAAGLLAYRSSVPVFTYSRRKNTFFNISGAEFADHYPNPLNYKIEDFLMIAGGMMYTGRVENDILENYMDIIDPFFEIFMDHRRSWVKIITYMQFVSQWDSKDTNIPLNISGPISIKKHGKSVHANEDALQRFEEIGMIQNLSMTDTNVSFQFRDHQCRKWLRDVGSVLELYVYKACLETRIFHDVRTSVIVNWEGTGDVSNEIDVMSSLGITPFFISCKTGDVRTEAVNELAVLRDRFGGEMARAAIVTASKTPAALRHRALEMDITVIDNDLLTNGNLKEILASLAGVSL